MEIGKTQPVLRCSQCNKPFDKTSSLKRHGYYCRSRRTSTATRPRACLSCAKDKVRCNNQRPVCSRCSTRAIECRYTVEAPKDVEPKLHARTSLASEIQKTTSALPANPFNVKIYSDVSGSGTLPVDDTLASSILGFTDPGGELLGWDISDIDLSNIWGPSLTETDISSLSPEMTILAPHPAFMTGGTIQGQSKSLSPSTSIPRMPTDTVRKMIQRPKIKPGSTRVAQLILYNLKSYPLAMLRQNDLPPFIHHTLTSLDMESQDQESLTNCISLVHMINAGVQTNRKLFWKNVQLDCERLCVEHVRFNDRELLAAMEALTIYILIRLDEGESEHNNFDFLMLAAVTVVAQQLVTTCQMQLTTPYDHDIETSWRNWIFRESLQRLCVIYQVVNMLVYFEPAAMCGKQADLVLAPLPARKQLWEACDASSWKTEMEKQREPEVAYGLASNGDLVRLAQNGHDGREILKISNSSHSNAAHDSAANWAEWCSGMDGMGGLIMLAASLVA